MFSTVQRAMSLGNLIACGMLLPHLGCAPGTHAIANPVEEIVQRDLAIVPDPQLQRQIGKVVHPGPAGPSRDELQVLAEMGGPDGEKLIPQLLYYSIYGTDPAGKHDLKEGMALAGCADLLKIPRSQIATALVPYLGTRDAKLQPKLREIFDGFDFAFWQEFLQRRLRSGQDLPPELIPYLYQRSPAEALLTMARTLAVQQAPEESSKQWRTLIWAEHAVSDTLWKHAHEFLEPTRVEPEAATQIAKLASDNHWWVRLYAAEILRQHPGFRQAELLEKLAQDDHPLVRESAAASQAAQQPESPPSPPPSPSPSPSPSPLTEELKK
ncbi:MAG: HEAT repeat domain-containing protein [Pirellulaceae bacterium]